jgi:hypothetical protein
MTSDGEPPLPETGDPFELLGVAPDADERTIRRAYATLIKRFRPDRAPDEFQRIQAAFEIATRTREIQRLVDLRHEPPPPEAPREAELRGLVADKLADVEHTDAAVASCRCRCTCCSIARRIASAWWRARR